MSFHTGISLLLVISSTVLSALTDFSIASSVIFGLLYAFNIFNDKRELIDDADMIRKELDEKLVLIKSTIDNNRDNNEVIVKEMKKEMSDASSKMNEIRLSGTTAKTQQANNATKYRF